MNDDLRLEFRDLIALYQSLGEELARIVRADDPGDPQALVQTILLNRECFERISQMGARVAQLSDRWKKSRADLESGTRDETSKLVEAAKCHAARMHAMCTIHAEKLKITRARLENCLAETGKGSQYLKSLKPAKNNYPKFIDSMH
jgi:hypothetical protein